MSQETGKNDQQALKAKRSVQFVDITRRLTHQSGDAVLIVSSLLKTRSIIGIKSEINGSFKVKTRVDLQCRKVLFVGLCIEKSRKFLFADSI